VPLIDPSRDSLKTAIIKPTIGRLTPIVPVQLRWAIPRSTRNKEEWS